MRSRTSSSKTGPRILIVRLSAIGDVVVTTPVARAVKEALPDAWITWLVDSRARDVLLDNPYVDEVISWNRRKGTTGGRQLWPLLADLRKRRFDWAIDFQGLMRSAVAARLSGARRVVGNTAPKEPVGFLYHERVPRRTDELSNRQRCLDLLKPLGIRSADRRMIVGVSDERREQARRLLASAGLPAGQAYACLVPATTWAQKHWVEEYWARLAELLEARQGLSPVILGGPNDLPLAERIAARSGARCVIAAGQTGLREAAAVLEGARLTAAVDTALMHISVAVGTPTAGVVGASYWPAFADYENFRLVRAPEACPHSPCLRHPKCEGRFECMRELTPERVFDAACDLLGTSLPVLV